MRKKELRGVQEITDKIFELKEQNKANDAEMKRLYGLLAVAKNERNYTSEPPFAFDYREAILNVFREKRDTVLRIDNVVREISHKYHFEPDKLTITTRMNYMADRDKTLERVIGRRGFYRLPPNNQNIHAQDNADV